ncbi:hypothetical protein [Pedobacter soli]|uniref:Uncharacterized protein n=1 Tax=Pedobacter soli TaxID=390242 RepID=A0A1G7AZ56_9SPHI|nr:hypothetical protein [Pedobacter soli]SDE20051.1 hypothetical protein SAMN04488024_113108 [Pedobacter soli]
MMKFQLSLLFGFLTVLAFGQNKGMDTLSKPKNVRVDGFYSSSDKEPHLTSKNMLVFTPDGRVGAKQGGTTGNEPFSCAFYESFRREYIGTYRVAGDSIFVSMKFLFKKGTILHAKFDRYNAFLAGKITDGNTITGWRVVPPFPNQLKKKDFEFGFNQNWMLPQKVIFIKSDAVKCLVGYFSENGRAFRF